MLTRAPKSSPQNCSLSEPPPGSAFQGSVCTIVEFNQLLADSFLQSTQFPLNSSPAFKYVHFPKADVHSALCWSHDRTWQKPT